MRRSPRSSSLALSSRGNYAEAVQLAYAATNTFSQAKGKGKGKGKDKGKPGVKVSRSNLMIAGRKAKLTEPKAESRCLRCGVLGRSAGGTECRFRGNAPKGSAPTPKPIVTPALTGGTAKPQNPKPQGCMALDGSDEEVVYLRNSCSDSRGFMALNRRGLRVPLAVVRVEGLCMSFQLRRSAASAIWKRHHLPLRPAQRTDL